MKYTKRNFVIESNAIEGYDSPIHTEETNPYYIGHMKAYDYITKAINSEPLTEKIILKSHFYLMNEIMDKAYAGNYRTVMVQVGSHVAPQVYQIPRLMEILLDLATKANSIDDCWIVHHFYESIHPFVDGNGRSGRCLLNALLKKNGHKPIVIESEYKYDYYKSIINWRKKNFKKIVYTNGAI